MHFKVTQCLVIIVKQHIQWLEIHIKIHGMAGKQCVFSTQKTGKRSLSEYLAGISTLSQCTASDADQGCIATAKKYGVT